MSDLFKFSEPKRGDTVYAHESSGKAKILKINNDGYTLEYSIKKIQWMGTEHGFRENKTHLTVNVGKADLMTQGEHEYACWKGTAGQGRMLRELIAHEKT